MNNIDYRFKILYCVGMIVIVSGHTFNGGISLFYELFPPYSFHLPLFMFCSGYFFASASINNPFHYILRKLKKQCLPLYIWNAIYGLFTHFLRQYGFEIGKKISVYTLFLAPIIDGHQFELNLGGWYVIPLVTIQSFEALIRYPFQALFKRRLFELIPLILHFLLGCLGVGLSANGYRTGMWIVLNRSLFFLPFFELGIVYNHILEEIDKKVPTSLYMLFILTIQFAILLRYKQIPTYTPSWCLGFSRDHLLIPYVVGIQGIAFWLRVATILEPSIGKSTVVNLIANHSYAIMLHQYIGVLSVATLFCFIDRLYQLNPRFDWTGYRRLGYMYLVHNLSQFQLLYLCAGLFIPIIIDMCLRKLRDLYIWIKSYMVV